MVLGNCRLSTGPLDEVEGSSPGRSRTDWCVAWSGSMNRADCRCQMVTGGCGHCYCVEEREERLIRC